LIAFLDTSALVKRYVREPGSAEVLSLFERDPRPALSRIAWVEAGAAFTRRMREGALSPSDLDRLLLRLAREVGECRVVEVTEEIVARSVRAVRSSPLRAYDAVHLASALWLRERLDPDVRFVCADRALARLAGEKGLTPVVPGL